MSVCVQQGEQAGQAGYQLITQWGRPACCLLGQRRAACTDSPCRPQVSRLPSAILIIISQRNATQVRWRNCNLNKNAEKHPKKCSMLCENRQMWGLSECTLRPVRHIRLKHCCHCSLIFKKCNYRKSCSCKKIKFSTHTQRMRQEEKLYSVSQ